MCFRGNSKNSRVIPQELKRQKPLKNKHLKQKHFKDIVPDFGNIPSFKESFPAHHSLKYQNM